MEKEQTAQAKHENLTQEGFKELAKDMKPVLKSMEEVLEKHNIECLTSLCINSDGYFNFSLHDSEWEFRRLNHDAKMMICRNITEEV